MRRKKGYAINDMYTTREQRLQRIRPRVIDDQSKINLKKMEAMYKIVLIGDSGAGKTSALLRFSDDVFTQHPMTTVGVDFKMKTLKIDKKVIKLQIWDTAGQEKFGAMSQSYFRNSNGCLAFYDVTNKESFDSLEKHIIKFLTFQNPNYKPP